MGLELYQFDFNASFWRTSSVDVEALIESHFRARWGSQMEKVILGTRGLVVVFRNPENTDPRLFAVKTLNPATLSRIPNANAVPRFKRELEQWYRSTNIG